MIEASPLAEFTGQVALVTGGGSGIGRAIALRWAAGGGDVVVLGRRPEPLEETAELARTFGVRAGTVGCDVRDADAVARVAAAVSRLVAEHPEVTEVEVNPLRVGPSGALAVDALVLVTDGEER